MSGRRRRRVEPTDDWIQLRLLCAWPEQARYEEQQNRPRALQQALFAYAEAF